MGGRTALDRVIRAIGGSEVADRLIALPGADLTTLLLHVMHGRAARRTPTDVFRRYREDRFATPAGVPFDQLRQAEDQLLSLLPNSFERITLSPVVPLGTHSVLGTVHQDTVLATVRGTEVAADATNGLALVAADRRRQHQDQVVQLATLQRLTRAQPATGAGRFAHFGLLGMVSAGRDTGDRRFERTYVVEHVRCLVSVPLAAGAGAEVRLTVARPALAPVGAAIRAALADLPGVTVVDDPDRPAGDGYYAGLRFKVFAVRGTERVELGDGGVLDWTSTLLGNRKERLVTSGIGVEARARL
jgi:hypothetical protein